VLRAWPLLLPRTEGAADAQQLRIPKQLAHRSRSELRGHRATSVTVVTSASTFSIPTLLPGSLPVPLCHPGLGPEAEWPSAAPPAASSPSASRVNAGDTVTLHHLRTPLPFTGVCERDGTHQTPAAQLEGNPEAGFRRENTPEHTCRPRHTAAPTSMPLICCLE